VLILHACDFVESDFAWDEDREHALACLRRGLALARVRGYHSMLWLRRVTMAKVAVRGLEYGIETEHVRAIVRKHRLVPDHVPARLEAWPWRYRLRGLGTFELKEENPDAPSKANGATRQSSLRGMPLLFLQAVLAFGARGVRDSQLIDALWPDAEGDAGRRVFDTTLHRLRRQLGADQVVRLSDGRVFLDGRLCWLDIWALEDLLAETEQEMRTGARLPILADLGCRLLSVYRGPLLQDESRTDAWILRSRERIARKFSRAVEPLGQALEKGGLFADAAAIHGRALAGDPLAETCCAGLTRCAVATGRPADAAQIFEEYRARLATRTDAEPGPEVVGLFARLVRPPTRGRIRP